MNSKLIKASLAGVAAIAVTAGGTTFAAWSDFADVTGNDVGAGVLKMTLDPLGANPGDDLVFDNLKLAPGQYYERQVYVATNDAESTPAAKLFFDVTRMEGAEDGCSTNSEGAEDDCEPGAGQDVDGDLLDEATIKVASYNPGPGNVCNYLYAPAGQQVTIESGGLLKDALALPERELTTPTPKPAVWNSALVDNVNLSPGEGMCVAVTVALPSSGLANKAQGDTASFDLRLTVKQDTFTYGSDSEYFVD